MRPRIKKAWTAFAVFVLWMLLLVAVGSIKAQGNFTIAIAWDETVHPDFDHYEIGIGTESGTYFLTIETTETAYTLSSLNCEHYFVNVRSCEALTGQCGEWDGEVDGYPLASGVHCRAITTTGVHRTDVAAGPGS